MPVLYKLNQDKRLTSTTKGRWFARSVQVATIDIEGLAKIMQANCTVKAADIKAVLTELAQYRARSVHQGHLPRLADRYRELAR